MGKRGYGRWMKCRFGVDIVLEVDGVDFVPVGEDCFLDGAGDLEVSCDSFLRYKIVGLLFSFLIFFSLGF